MDLEIIKQICETYDVRLIDKLSPEARKILVKMVMTSGHGFRGLIKIIRNYIDMPLRSDEKTVHYIRGPYTLTVHKSLKYHKYIYVFGEYHIINNECLKKNNSMKVEDFLASYIEKSDKFIDLMIEVPFIDKNTYETSRRVTHMSDINDKFEIGCTGVEKKCKYPNLRYHYTDIRAIKSTSTSKFLQAIDNFTAYLAWPEDYMFSILDKIVTDLEIVYNAQFSTNEELNRILEKEYYKLKIEKQLNQMDKEVKDILLKFAEQKIKNINQQNINVKQVVKYLLDKIKSNIRLKSGIAYRRKSFKTQLPVLREFFTQLHSVFIGGLSLIYMDIYTLSRIFRTYKPIKNMNSHAPKYVILYAGDRHANNYREFLDIAGFEKIYDNSTHSGADNCLDIRGLPPRGGSPFGSLLFPEYM